MPGKKRTIGRLLCNHPRRCNLNRPGFLQRNALLLLVSSVCFLAPACSGLPWPVTFHDPLTASEHVALGETYRNQGDHEAAAREFETAIQGDPEYVPAFIALGDLASESGAWDHAELNYRNALKLSPDHPVAANNLAMVYLSKGERLDETERLARQALKQKTNFRPYIQETLATLYVQQGRLEEAQLAIDEAEATLRPEHIALQERLRELRHEIASQQTLMPTPP